jgi:hypothetical protein
MQRAIDIRGLSKGQVPERDVRGSYDRRVRPGHGFSQERYSSQNRIASVSRRMPMGDRRSPLRGSNPVFRRCQRHVCFDESVMNSRLMVFLPFCAEL